MRRHRPAHDLHARDLSDADLSAFGADLARDLRRRRGAGGTDARLRPTRSADAELAAARLRVLDAAALLPASWVRAGNALGPVGVRLHGQEGRGEYLPSTRTLYVDSQPGTALHEYSHHLQAAMPGLQALCDELHVRRTTFADGTRHPVEALAEYIGAVRQPDDYVITYMSRRYEFDGGRALEVLTVGLQTLLLGRGPNPLYSLRVMLTNDPELADLLIGALYHYDP